MLKEMRYDVLRYTQVLGGPLKVETVASDLDTTEALKIKNSEKELYEDSDFEYFNVLLKART